MLFNSLEYIGLFLPLCIVACLLFKSSYLSILLIFSTFFYAYWDIHYLPLPLGSICINFLFLRTRRIEKNRLLFWLAIAFNLGLLVYFKYFNFLGGNIAQIFDHQWTPHQIILPLGISFLTFQQISCLYANYRHYTFSYTLKEYALYILIFPHQIAGPILQYGDLLPQFKTNKRFKLNARNIAVGLLFFSIGFSKKVLLADLFAVWANRYFQLARETDGIATLDGWTGSLSYTLQLYFDFSGYADMAVGSALFFNFMLPANFDSPYKATSIIDFWRRWHLSLSVFLRDHIYIPLGGNKYGRYRRYLNVFVTMLLGGMWHGAGWTYVIWGALHGLFICINHLFRDLNLKSPLPNIAKIICTLFIVNILWVYFRAPDLKVSHKILSAMFGLGSNVSSIASNISIFAIVVGFLICFFPLNSHYIASKFSSELNRPSSSYVPVVIGLAAIVFALSIYVVYVKSTSPNYRPQFIYFQF